MDHYFPPTNERDWRERIAMDLKDGDTEARLLWNAEPGVEIDAVCTRESPGGFPDQRPRHDVFEIVDPDSPRSNNTLSVDLFQIEPVSSACDQCAVAAALLLESLPAGQVPGEVNVRVPVGTRIGLEVGKLRALRLLLEETLRVATSEKRKPGSTDSAWQERIKILSVATDDPCRCPDRQTHQIRLTYACIAALLGGSDGVAPIPFDESDESARLARNVLLVLRHESGLTGITCVANGSYYINQVSARLFKAARRKLLAIQAAGGFRRVTAEGMLDKLLSTTVEETRTR